MILPGAQALLGFQLVIVLTNTLSVGKVADAAVKWMSKKYPGIGSEEDVVIPVVGECDDSFLNDAVGRHIRTEHVYKSIDTATTPSSHP